MGLYIIGAILFLIIGIVLSLLGSGGAILTIPVLVYFFDINPYWATSYSLFIMGVSNWNATIYNIKSKLIHYKVALYFAIPGLLVTYFIRRFIMPVIPEIVYENEMLSLTKGTIIMLLFSILIFYTAIRTLKVKTVIENTPLRFSPVTNALQGAGIGIVTGFAGAGGGFLIVPALLFTVKIPMKEAVATSLFIISITTSLGFIGDLNPAVQMDWPFLFYCVVFAMAGIYMANLVKDKFSNTTLKQIFGYFILGLSIFIFLVEINELANIF